MGHLAVGTRKGTTDLSSYHKDYRIIFATALSTSLHLPQAPSKASHLSSRINEEIKRVAAVMGTVCIVGAFLTTLWNAQVRSGWAVVECFAMLADPFPMCATKEGFIAKSISISPATFPAQTRTYRRMPRTTNIAPTSLISGTVSTQK